MQPPLSGRHDLARQGPSFLKRQKELQRNARAAAKRARRESKREQGGGLDSMMARVDEFGHIVEIDDETPEAAGDDPEPVEKPNG